MTITAQTAAGLVQGFNTTVQWTSFTTVQNPASPRNAHIDPRYTFQTGTAQLRAGVYRFPNLRATVTVNGAGTWVRQSWFQSARSDEKDWLLRHEQGHVDLVRLAVRDLVQAVGSLEWSEAVVTALRDAGNSATARLHWAQRQLQDDARVAVQRAENLIRELAGTPPADGLYDTDTDHGDTHARQDIWNRVFDRCVQTGESLTTALWVFGLRAQP
jgi:hypothetical protein